MIIFLESRKCPWDNSIGAFCGSLKTNPKENATFYNKVVHFTSGIVLLERYLHYCELGSTQRLKHFVTIIKYSTGDGLFFGVSLEDV
jgi:hypothetical protein